jgi:TetR/AcrR family transcriptional regulator, lmrAB and yxaGH operons repressor
MGRKTTVPEEELIARLSCVFRDVGYEGATLSLLEEATGLKKASLYHRFPNGKEQMANEVLESAQQWLEEHVLTPLHGSAPPEARIDAMVKRLDQFYSGGRQACLLNILSSSKIDEGPFTKSIRKMFEAWVSALTAVARDAGADPKAARRKAERVIMLLEGSLVFSRGIGSTQPFRRFLKSVPSELLESKGVTAS